VQKLLESRYFRNQETSWEELVERVVNFVCLDENYKSNYFNIIKNRFFIPSSPCLMNSGIINQLSSCFIVDVEEDTMDEIMSTASECAKIFQKNGGKFIASLQQ